MFYKGVLHSRGLIEEFREYLRRILQAKTLPPMSTQTMYNKMIDLTLNSTSIVTSILKPMVSDMFLCFQLDLDGAADSEKKNVSNQIVQELGSLYRSLSESVHSMKMPPNSRAFLIHS